MGRGRACNVASQATKTLLLNLFRPRFTGHAHARSAASTLLTDGEVSPSFGRRPALARLRAGQLVRSSYQPQTAGLCPEYRMLRPENKCVVVLDFSRLQPDGAGPPTSAKGCSPTNFPGPSSVSSTAPVANGRGLPYSSVTSSTARVASMPSPSSSSSSSSMWNRWSTPFEENVLGKTFRSPRNPSIRRSPQIRRHGATPLKVEKKKGGCGRFGKRSRSGWISARSSSPIKTSSRSQLENTTPGPWAAQSEPSPTDQWKPGSST